MPKRKPKALEPDEIIVQKRQRRPRTPAQIPWREDPVLLERIVTVWDLYLRRVPIMGIIRHISENEKFKGTFRDGSISRTTIKNDVARARELWREEFAERTDELVSELDAQRHQLGLEVYQELDRLEQLRDALYPCGVDKEGEVKYTRDSPAAIAAAKAKLFKIVEDNLTSEEKLLGVRRDGGEGVTVDNRVQILVMEGTKVRKLEESK